MRNRIKGYVLFTRFNGESQVTYSTLLRVKQTLLGIFAMPPLAVTGEKILLRSEKIRNTLELCLSQIQNMVPPWLEAKISRVLDDLRVATFTIESSEAEAGKVLLALIRLDIAASTSVNMSELKPLQMAALWLHITTPMAVLMERRSIKRLLEKVQGTDPNKEKILKYLLYLVRKYGRSIGGYQTEPVVLNVENSWEQAQIAVSGEHEPPEQFKCPLSTRLMYDPVIIANGQTFERVWIEKWFDEGHKTCPKTDTKLADLLVTPNDAIKDLISRWCATHGVSVPKPCSQPTPPDHRLQKLQSSSSIASFGSSMNGLRLQISNVSIRSSNTNCGFDLSHEKIKEGIEINPSPINLDPSNSIRSSNTNSGFDLSHEKIEEGIEINPSPINLDPFNLKLHTNGRGISLSFLSQLSTLPWPSQCKAVEDVKTGLEKNSVGSHAMISNSYIKPLIRFLKDAYDRYDLKAQRDGAGLILTFLLEIGNEMPPLQEDAIYVLSSLLDSEITEEALAIMEIVSIQQCYKSTILAGVLPSILRILGNHIGEHHLLLLALKILNNFSANMDTAQHMVYLDFISKLAPFLGYRNLADIASNIQFLRSDFKSDTSQESADSPKQKKKASKASRFLGKGIAMLSKRRH
ncbi:plant U-box 45 [Actinidia rufa]|uniref:RING-type E3 ubiquitin transferase n=1 Tax=Actinidia rufa TaxID=165716 RepID=A0A7J0GHW1_9ERIC|nr:plant U-box 45 [Actinidia rufa]